MPYTKERLCEDTARRPPPASHRERPQEKPTLLTTLILAFQSLKP
jgi:hypothetical protein